MAARDQGWLGTATRRYNRAPVQYIVGEWDFCEVRLRVRAPVLVPRPETEQLAQLAAARLRQLPSARLLDVGCGSGALCCSLLHQLPHMSALAVDQSAEACRLTAENAALNGVGDRLEVRHLALTEDDLPGVGSNLFDMVVSNPPYVPSGDVDRLQPEILLYEDRAALDGGADGLEVVRLLVRAAADWLRPGGLLLLEVDPRQPAAISRLVLPGHHRLTYRSTHCDFSGRHRFVELVRSAEPAAG